MADTKQATAETMCEWCGEIESKHPVTEGVNGHVLRECLEFDPQLTALRASHKRLAEALESVQPYMEAAETAGLVGDEACHWPVENVRAVLADARKLEGK